MAYQSLLGAGSKQPVLQVGQLAGERYDVCIVFPYKIHNGLRFGEHSDPVLTEPSLQQRQKMEAWQKKRNIIMKQLTNCGLAVKAFYSRDKDEVFVKIGTDFPKLQELAEITKYKLMMKDEYDNAYAPYVRDFPGRPEVNYADRKKVSHVYKTHDDEVEFQRPDAIFRTVDRILLIDHCIRSKDKGCAGIDIGALIKAGDAKAYFPLHESRKLEAMDRDWSSVFVFGTGVDKARDYFGERVAFYFAWMAHFNRWLAFAALLGLVFYLFHVLAGTPNNFMAPLFCMAMAVWAVLFTHFWRRKAAAKALLWGVFDLQPELEAPRPEFKGTRRINPITGKQDLYYPWRDRICKVLFSYAVIASAMIGGLFVMAVVFLLRHANHESIPGGRLTFMLLLAVVVDVLNAAVTSVAKTLTEWENYRTQTDYENALLAKTLVFKVLNSFSALYYIAFFKQDGSLFGSATQCVNGDCLMELSWQLTVFFLYRLIASNFVEFVWPRIVYQVEALYERASFKGSKGAVLQDMSLAEQQAKKEDYNPFDDFDEMIIQFGYVTLFVVAVPWLPFLGLFANLVELYVDKSKLLHSMRRPLPVQVKDNGTWDTCFEVMGFLAVFTNAAIIVFTTASFSSSSAWEKLLWFLVLEHLIILTRVSAEFFTPSVPDYVRILHLKQKHIVHKFVDCVEEEDENMRIHALQGRELNIVVHDVDDDDDD